MSGQMDFQTFTQAMFDLYQDKKYGPALEYVEQGMAAFPDQTARITFWRVCLLSLCGRGEEALAVLSDGLEAGLWWHQSQFRDTDLDSIRDLPRFKELVSKSHQGWMEAGLKAEPDRTVLVPSRSGPYPLLIALHGYGGNKDSNLKYWQIACEKGWMVLSPQSQQPLYPQAYFWETPEAGVEIILFHLDQVRRNYRIDAERIVVAGMSQGGGMAALAGLSPKIQAAGSISVATWWEDTASFDAAAKTGKSSRAYFVTGLKDQSLERSRQIQAVLRDHQIPVEEEVHPELGHDFPPDFDKSLEKAFQFIFS